jgi:hypothetical protein
MITKVNIATVPRLASTGEVPARKAGMRSFHIPNIVNAKRRHF